MGVQWLLERPHGGRDEHRSCRAMLTGLAGLQDMQTPELKVAIKSAQRLAERMISSGGPKGASPPGTPLGFRG